MPGASGWPLSLSAPRAAAPARGRARARSSSRGRPPGRSSIGLLETADDGGFDADLDRPAVDDQVDPPAEVALHMRGRGRRDMARQIGRRRHHRPAERAQDVARDHGWAGTRIAMVSSPAVARSATGQSVVFGSTSVSGPGQNACGQRDRVRIEAARSGVRGLDIADMGDQRIERGPALGLVEPRDRRGIGGVGAEPIDGLGRERDQAALARGSAPPRPRRPRRQAKSALSGPHSRGVHVLNSASCGVRNPRL